MSESVTGKKQKRYLRVKRSLDVILSGGAIVLLSPVLGAISLAIKLDSPGPIFFKQQRVGKDKKLFEIWKFRSMRADTPEDIPTHLLDDPDAFITRTGRFLRRTSLDELPQIFNILRGQMSIVGPRPALWNQDDLVAERDKYGVNSVTPGLTGWAQINGRDELEIPVKAKFDGEYIAKMGLRMDLTCFLATVGSVLTHDGVKEGGTGEMHKEGAKTGDGSEILVPPEKIKKEVAIGAVAVGAAGAAGIGVLTAIGKHAIHKKNIPTSRSNSHVGIIILGVASAAAAVTISGLYMKKRKKSDGKENIRIHVPKQSYTAENSESITQKRVLITGANSYIGSAVEDWLHKYPERYAVDTLDMTEDTWNDYDFSNYDVVYHVAGIAHIKEKKENADLYYKINRDLAAAVAKKAKAEGVRQFIFMSTMSVYGVNTGVITKETLTNPKSNYGKSKLQAEQLLFELADETFDVAVLRPPMVYGKDCKGNFQSLVQLVKRFSVFPYMENQRSMIYIDNLCSFVKLCIDRNLSGLYFPQNKNYVKTNDMAKIIAKKLGKEVKMSRMLGSLVKAGMPFSETIQKGFGSLIYSDTEDFDFSYCVIGNKKSIWKSL